MLKRIYQRWLNLISPSVLEQEIEEELRFHLEMQSQALVEHGSTPDAANAEARRRFGDLVAVRRECVRLRRRNRIVFRVVRTLLVLLLLLGAATRVLSIDPYLQHMGDLLIVIGFLGFVLTAVKIARPVELPHGGSTFSTTL